MPAMTNRAVAMKRRDFLKLSALSTAAAGLQVAAVLPASATANQLRIGYQKNGVMVIARQQGVLERKLATDRTDVRWIEFVAGPPLLEAMNAGSIDIGQTGDTPPIFAQAAGAAIVYVAGQPTTNGQGILVRSTSDIRTLADLKGKRVGFTKGSSAHNVIVVALEKAGLTYGDITPIYLSPPDAAAAFSRETIDAWAIWDPYFAVGERNGGRILVQAREIAKTNSFYIANRDFAARQPDVVRGVIDALAETARWAEGNRDKVARILAEATGLDLDIQTIAANRSSFAIGEVTEDIITAQQAVADRFQKLGLIPTRINVRDAVWTAARS
jgi:sulfonate transport system substrate-binding protein